MNELKHLTHPNSLLALTSAVQKISQSIKRQKAENVKENAIKEIEFLKEHCLSNNARLSLLSCQTLYSLVEDGVLLPANVLTMFISQLSSAKNGEQNHALSEGIINVLLFDMKQRSAQTKSERYRCPFGLNAPPHPMITLLQKKNASVTDLANKMNGICNHRNKFIRSTSLEFLRPVFTFVMCNPMLINGEMKSIWSLFLRNATKSTKSMDLFYDTISWIRIASPANCLHLTIFLIETIDHLMTLKRYDALVDFQIYLIALLPTISDNCHDPRPLLNCIQQTHEECPEKSIWTGSYFNYLLITMAELLHIIPSFYLPDALRLIKYLIETENEGNILVRQMILDGLVVRLGIGAKTLSSECSNDIGSLIHILKSTSGPPKRPQTADDCIDRKIKYFHPKIALNFDLTLVTEELCDGRQSVTAMLDKLMANDLLCIKFQYVLRGLLLIGDHLDLTAEEWLRIWTCLQQLIKTHGEISTDLMYCVLYHLAKEIDGKKQLELLKAMSSFAAIKENMPLILNTYRVLATSSPKMKTLSLNLYTRLWMIEPRVYQCLYDALTVAPETSLSKSDAWESNIAKAHTIKEICSIKASQHGIDLVVPLSNILNQRGNDLATSLAIDAIVLLCNSNTMNIVSTWKSVKTIFQSNSEHRTVRSLCEFFGTVPTLKSPSAAYDQLLAESLQHLWHLVIDYDKTELIAPALRALKNFDFTELTFKHVPVIFTENVRIPNEFQKIITASLDDPTRTGEPLTAADVVPYIPGECWIELLEKVNQNAIDAAIDLVTHLIDAEICQFRSGIYMVGDDRGEPGELVQLHARSPLRALTKRVKTQSDSIANPLVLTHCLRCLAQKYSRPLPPLNWFFLAAYINAGDDQVPDYDGRCEMRKYAMTIAANQIAHSGSAKNIIENYVQAFDVADSSDEAIQMIFDLLPSICNGLTPAIFAKFLNNTLTFLFGLSKSSCFEVNCGFERAIEGIANIFKAKCLVTENVDITIDELTKYETLLEPDTRIHKKYCELLIELPTEILNRISSPASWTLDNFKKSFTLRLALINGRKSYINEGSPLMWLNAVVDACLVDKADDHVKILQQELILERLPSIIRTYQTNSSEMCDWLLYSMSKTQAHLTVDSSQGLFSLDFFIYAIVIATGCEVFCPPLRVANSMDWLDRLPLALDMLSKSPQWSGNIARIFEFLYHLNTHQTDLPDQYRRIACQALICTKNHEYFLRKSTWMKFIDLPK